MAVINLGRVGYVHKGAYNSATTYQKYDVVLYNHGSYLYIGEAASQGHAPTDTVYWQAMLDPTQMNAATEAAVNAAEAAHASAMELAGQVDRLTTPFSVTGDMATCHPVSDYPLGVISYIEPVQAGSGDPSPSNVRPITGWTGATLNRTGKNLCPYVMHNETVPLRLLKGRTYTVSISDESADSITLLLYKDGVGANYFQPVYINGRSENRRYGVFTLDADTTHINFTWGASADLIEPQIEEGTTATTYEPYQGNQYTAQFGQTVYGGVWNWKKGLLTVTHALTTLTGDEAFETAFWSGKTVCVYLTSMPLGDGKACSHFKTSMGSHDATLESMWYANGYIGYYGSMTLDEFKAYLAAQYAAGTPVQICYELAAPYSIQLTPQQILSLAGENNLWSDTRETTVNGPNSPKVMENRIAALEAAILNA